MIYLIFIIMIFLILKVVKLDKNDMTKNNKINFWLKYLPIAILFVLLFSLQYDVGTDYFSYLEGGTKTPTGIKKMSIVFSDYELFSGLIMLLVQSFFHPQMIFFFYAFVQVIVYGYILKYLIIYNWNIKYVFFLYFTVAISFFNSFNAVRQCTAIPFFILSVIYILDDKRKISYIMLVCGALFHHSTLFLLPIIICLDYFRKKTININFKYVLVTIFAISVLYFFDINNIINNIIAYIPSFSNLAFRNYVEKMPLLNIVTRLLKVIPVIYCYYKLDITKLTFKENQFLNISYFSLIILFFSFSSSIIWRIYGFFDLFLLVPLILYFKMGANKKEKIIIMCYYAIMLFLKIVLFPSGEYLYNSIILLIN